MCRRGENLTVFNMAIREELFKWWYSSKDLEDLQGPGPRGAMCISREEHSRQRIQGMQSPRHMLA